MFDKLIVVATAAALTGSAATAQQARREPAQLRSVLECRKIPADDARVRCYDAAVASLARATQSGAVVVVDQESIRRARRSLFGLSLPKLPFLGGDNDQDTVAEIRSTIRSARPFEYNKWSITLEDGAVWQTTDPDTRSKNPRPGDSVTIRRGSLGSFRITWSGSRSLGAIRVR